ncbi:hypothetical protein [Bradyrhizobium sp. 5.13L]
MPQETLLALSFARPAFAAHAQQPGIKRTLLQKVEFPDGCSPITANTHGDKSLKVLGIYVTDGTRPLASPAP